jgi:hypothetical protein
VIKLQISFTFLWESSQADAKTGTEAFEAADGAEEEVADVEKQEETLSVRNGKTGNATRKDAAKNH